MTNLNSLPRLKRFAKNSVFLSKLFDLWNFHRFHFIFWTEVVRENFVFLSKLLSIEVLMVINSFHSSNRSVKVFVFHASCLRIFEVNQFISSIESVCEEVEVFKKAFSAVKFFNFSKWLHRQHLFLLFFKLKFC